MLRPDFQCDIVVGGVTIQVEMEPGCWIGNGRLAILASGKDVGGDTYSSTREFNKATDADVKRLLKKIKLAPCSVTGCNGRFIAGERFELYNKERHCEPHRRQALKERDAAEQVRQKAKQAAADTKQKAKGFTYKATVWIHRDGRSDTYVVTYFKTKPTKDELTTLAKKHRSKIVDDFRIQKL